MLALLAIATTSVAFTGCGQIICRRSDLRMPAIRLGAGLVVLLMLSLLASSLMPGSTAESIALSALIAAAVVATGLVLRLARRHPTGTVVAPADRFEPGATVVEAEMLLAVSEVFSQAASLAECLPEVARRLLQRAES